MNTLRNQVQLIGHLGKDPEIKTLESGKKMAKLTIATKDSYLNEQGQKVETTEWHNVTIWGKQVNIIEKYLLKGKEVGISGKLTYRDYEDKDGVKRYVTDIVGNELLLLGGK
ncbi:MAG: single-stranded DNA-binding protein [Flavobacteriaceae bacterium]|nr:single-stranded DNA-binding protein [Flavobacteriaceae bacterium]